MAKRLPAKVYTEAEIRRGLAAIALASGNTRFAAQQLKDAGKPIPRNTLQAWKRTRPELYAEVQADILPSINEAVIHECVAIARTAAEAEIKTLERYNEVLPELPARDVSKAARDISTVKGINLTKVHELRNQPTVIRHETSKTPEQLIAAMNEIIPGFFTDGQAVEIFEAELAEPDSPTGKD